MFMIHRLVLVQLTILIVRCIYGNAEEIKTVDDTQNLQTGNYGRLDQPSPFVEEHDRTPQDETPAEFLLMVHARDDNPLNNDFAEEDKMAPKLDVTNVSLIEPAKEQKDYLEKTTMDLSEQAIKSSYMTDFDPVDVVDVLRNQTADLLRAVTLDNRNLIMKMIKILEALKTFDESSFQEMLEDHPQMKTELLVTLSILENTSSAITNGIKAQAETENISAFISNGLTAQTNTENLSATVGNGLTAQTNTENTPALNSNGITLQTDSVPNPGFKPVKTIADVMALGKRQVSDIDDKRSFFCSLMYRTAFSVRRCWMFAKLAKHRQERMRRLAIARQMAAKKKFVFSKFRRMTAAST